eukprot:gene11179-13023_t
MTFIKSAKTLAINRFGKTKRTLKESKAEIVFLLEWTWPLLIANVLNNVAFLAVNMVFVGHLGTDELAAVALGNTFVFATSAMSMGALNAMDTLISQAYGAAGLSAKYVMGMMPGLWSGTALNILQKYLQGQGIMKPSIVIGLILNIFNAIFNFIFVHGLGSHGGIGVIGSSLATSLSKTLGFFALLGWIVYFRLHQYPTKTWFGFTREAFNVKGLKEYLRLGIPAGLQLAFEGCGFEVLTILAGLFQAKSLDAHTIAMNFTLLTFMLPMSISIALSVRIGQLLGSKQPVQARKSTYIGFGIAMSAMVIISLTQLLTRNYIGRIYSPDAEVQYQVSRILPISALFQFFDGYQTTCQGIIRGVGRNTIGATVNFGSFYLVGLPFSCLFAFALMHNIYGLWWGLCIGLGSNAVILGIVVWKIDWNLEMRKAIIRTTDDSPVNTRVIDDGESLISSSEMASVVDDVEHPAFSQHKNYNKLKNGEKSEQVDVIEQHHHTSDANNIDQVVHDIELEDSNMNENNSILT